MQRSIPMLSALLGACLLLTGTSRAEDIPPAGAERPSLPWYDRAQAGVSSWLVGTAARFDSFFGDPRAIEEDYSETYVRLRMGITQSRLNDTEWSSQAYARVPLPRL
ncbi:MAG: hypothetical protein FNT29_11660, partial [Halothiobacillaceae bacterium]